jgi:actin, other eukaryote
MLDDGELASIVIDNGTDTIKAGIAGDDAPRKCFDTLIGKSRFTGLDIALH